MPVLMSDVSTKMIQKTCVPVIHHFHLLLFPPTEYLNLLSSYSLVLAQRSFTDRTLLSFQVSSFTLIQVKSDPEETCSSLQRNMCFDSWSLLAVNIIISLYCLNVKCNFQDLNPTSHKRDSLSKKLWEILSLSSKTVETITIVKVNLPSIFLT